MLLYLLISVLAFTLWFRRKRCETTTGSDAATMDQCETPKQQWNKVGNVKNSGNRARLDDRTATPILSESLSQPKPSKIPTPVDHKNVAYRRRKSVASSSPLQDVNSDQAALQMILDAIIAASLDTTIGAGNSERIFGSKFHRHDRCFDQGQNTRKKPMKIIAVRSQKDFKETLETAIAAFSGASKTLKLNEQVVKNLVSESLQKSDTIKVQLLTSLAVDAPPAVPAVQVVVRKPRNLGNSFMIL